MLKLDFMVINYKLQVFLAKQEANQGPAPFYLFFKDELTSDELRKCRPQ